jgi:hypothetical protein
MADVIVIDDVVDLTTQDKIYNSIFSKDTQWTFSRTVFYDRHPEVLEKQKNQLMSFTHQLMDFNTGEEFGMFPLCSKPLIAGATSLGKSIKQVYNSRLQLQLPILTEKDKLYGVPHIDAHNPFEYKIGVYYVNQVDGDTVIFKQTNKNSTPENIKNGKLDIDMTIPPKKGRLIIFDGDIYHSVGKPKTDMRCIVNYNFNFNE